MSLLIDFFISIGDMISSAFSFLIHSIQEILFVVQVAGRVLVQIPSYFSWLPVSLVYILTSIFTIVVIYKIAGREG